VEIIADYSTNAREHTNKLNEQKATFEPSGAYTSPNNWTLKG
jgi:hypothetical protein